MKAEKSENIKNGIEELTYAQDNISIETVVS